MKYYRGSIILNNDNEKVNYKRFTIQNCNSKAFEISTNDGIIEFNGDMEHSIMLDAIIDILKYNDEQIKFGTFSKDLTFQGFNTPELNDALFLASLGNVIDLQLRERLDKEEVLTSRMLFFPQDKCFTQKQREFIEEITVENSSFAIAYAGDNIEDRELFSSFDAREELEYLKENNNSKLRK